MCFADTQEPVGRIVSQWFWVAVFLTFYGIVSFLIGDTAAVFLAILVPFGFTVAAILVPAVSAFDVALGRATNDRG